MKKTILILGMVACMTPTLWSMESSLDGADQERIFQEHLCEQNIPVIHASLSDDQWAEMSMILERAVVPTSPQKHELPWETQWLTDGSDTCFASLFLLVLPFMVHATKIGTFVAPYVAQDIVEFVGVHGDMVPSPRIRFALALGASLYCIGAVYNDHMYFEFIKFSAAMTCYVAGVSLLTGCPRGIVRYLIKTYGEEAPSLA